MNQTLEETRQKNREIWTRRKARANMLRAHKYFQENYEKTQARLLLKELEAARIAAEPPRPRGRPPDPNRVNALSANQQLIFSAKRGACQDCGNRFHPSVMDFDHRIPANKDFSISRGVKSARLGVLKAEVEKCDLVCANCHRVRESRRRAGLPATLPPPDYEI